MFFIVLTCLTDKHIIIINSHRASTVHVSLTDKHMLLTVNLITQIIAETSLKQRDYSTSFVVSNEHYMLQAIEKDSPNALKLFDSVNKEETGSLWFQLFR